MNSKSEKELCSLLLKNENNENVSVPNYPRLNPDSVKLISKTITKIVYGSLKNENTVSKNNRDIVLGLLSKWSKNNTDSHFNINSRNRSVVLKCLNNKDDKAIDPLFADFNKESLSEQYENKLWVHIYDCFEQANKIYFENKTSRDLVQALDSINLKSRGFICTVPNKIVQINDFGGVLSSMKKITNLDDNKSLMQTKNTPKIGNNLPELGYALLALERSKEHDILLTKIINDLIKKSNFSKDEYDFLYYTWINGKKLNLPADVHEKINISCKFLYEKPLLKIACEILSTENPDHNNILYSSDLSNILSSLKENKILYCNIQSCIYELYFLSNYDERLKELLFIVKEIVQSYKK